MMRFLNRLFAMVYKKWLTNCTVVKVLGWRTAYIEDGSQRKRITILFKK